jgi:hypothetical protein
MFHFDPTQIPLKIRKGEDFFGWWWTPGTIQVTGVNLGRPTGYESWVGASSWATCSGKVAGPHSENERGQGPAWLRSWAELGWRSKDRDGPRGEIKEGAGWAGGLVELGFGPRWFRKYENLFYFSILSKFANQIEFESSLNFEWF